MPAPPVRSLRRALEHAFAVAAAGEREQPPVAAPAELRPLLRFTKLPKSALETVAHVLDTDDDFRARVARDVERDDMGRVGWIWLTRPEGWEGELAGLLDELALDDVVPGRERVPDKSLRRQLEGAERARDRALDATRRAEAELERLRRELAELASERDAVAEQNAAYARRIDELTAERTSAIGELKRLETVLARRTDERRDLAARVDELEELLQRARSTPVPAEQSGGSARATLAAAELVELRRTIDDLHRRAEGFVAEIAGLRRDVRGDLPSDDDPFGDRGAQAATSAAPRRRPAPIPGGLTDDSDQVAAHLLGRRGAVLLVDGYNVSMAAWPGFDIAEQRSRLERLLADLAARNAGLAIELVFDGAEVVPLTRPGVRRAPGVTVRFTPAGVEADDALLELCEHYPHDRPVIVASNDRRVRDGARRRGANVVSAEQLLAVARPGARH